MKFDEFVKKYLGKGTDYDDYAGVQCVDLAKLYIDKVLGIKPQSIGNACAYNENFNDTYLKKYFTRIPYKAGEKPKKGDLVVWGKKYNGTSKYGHIAIATGESDSKGVYTYDQNWGKTTDEKKMRKVHHPWAGIACYLRPKDRSNIEQKKYFTPNATMKKKCVVYADNLKTVTVGTVEKDERIKVWHKGLKYGFIQYNISGGYKTGIVPLKYIDFDYCTRATDL